MSVFTLTRKAADRFSSFLAHIGMWGVFAMMLLVVTDVAMRAVANRSTLIAEEMGGYLLVLIAYLGMAEAYKLGRHIRVDIVSKRLTGKVRAWIDVGLSFIGLVALLIVIWRAVIMVYRSYAGNVIIPGIFLTPVYLPQTLVVIGLAALALQCAVDLTGSFYTLRKTSRDLRAKSTREVVQEW
jgi:TRAP-type C4-dicarboxylate transport system permease small subunit